MFMKNRHYFIGTVSLMAVALLNYAAASKLRDFATFVNQLHQSPLLTNYAKVVAIFIPCLEIILAVLIFFERSRLMGLYGFYCIMTLFSTYIVAITQFSESVPCSCGGILERMGWTEHLIFNMVFVALSTASILIYPEET
jgi:hypothetical protein